MSNHGKGSRVLLPGILNNRSTNKGLYSLLQMTVMMKCVHTANHPGEQLCGVNDGVKIHTKVCVLTV